MLDFSVSFLAWMVATSIPAFIGVMLITSLGKFARAKYLSSFALGIFFWFFVDTIQGSGDLDVNAGFSGGVDQIGIVALFVIGVIVILGADIWLASSDHRLFGSGSGGPHSLAIPILVALAVGIHGFGEGTAFGNTASVAGATSLLDEFGGLTAGFAYALHKALEPIMIGTTYIALSGSTVKSFISRTRDVLVITLVFIIPSLIGALTGFYLTYDATYFFALGTGTSIYAALRLTKPMFDGSGTQVRSDTIKIALCLILGFMSIYIAALLHS